MKLSFPAGDLYLEATGREFRVLLRGELLLKTPSEKRAVATYLTVRKSLEVEPPPAPELTTGQRGALLQKRIGKGCVPNPVEKGKWRNLLLT